MKKEEMKIEDLPGVGAATAEKLREAGYSTLMAIAVATPGELTESTGMGEASSRKVINAARNNLDMGFVSGEDLLKKREEIIKISTGSKAFDALVGGGFESGGITECYGQFGSGKSAIAHQLAINGMFIDEQGDPTASMVWIDSENSLPYNETILIQDDSGIRNVPIGKLVEEHLNETENIMHIGETVSTEENPRNIKAISFDPKDLKMKTFQITGFMKHKKQEIYEVIMESGRSVKVTKDHNFFHLDKNGEVNPIATRDLKIGSSVSVAGKIPISKKINEIDLSQLLAKYDLFVEGDFDNELNLIKETLKDIAKERNGNSDRAYNWIKRNKLPLKVYNKVKEKLNIDPKSLRIGSWSRKSNLPMIFPLDEEIMWVLGQYLAEGSCTLINNSVIITTTSSDTEERIKKVGSRLGLRFTRQKADIKVTSKVFSLLITELGFGSSAGKKRCPEIILKQEESNIVAFIEGYIEGDGHIGENNITCAETKSKGLSQDLLYVMCVLEKPARVREVFRTYNKEIYENKVFLKKEGIKYSMYAVSWQTNRARDSRLEELPNNERQVSKLLKEAIEVDGQSYKGLAIKSGLNYSYFCELIKGKKCGNSVRREKVKNILKNICKSEYSERLKILCEGEVWFDKIREIKEVGIEATYDIEVYPNNEPIQNFVGGTGGVILHNTFRPERIKQIAECNGLDPSKILRNIKVVRAFNSDHQMMCAEKVEDLILKEGLIVKLIIVDSLMTHFRSEFIGRGTLSDRQQKINKHMHTLMKIADQYNLCVYVTNQVMAKPDTFFGDPTAPIGGNIVGHNSCTRIYLRRGKKSTRVAKLVDSPYLPDGECVFEITDKGIVDA